MTARHIRTFRAVSVMIVPMCLPLTLSLRLTFVDFVVAC